MADVAPGILTNGLGGDHTAMIIGPFRLGFFKVEVVVPPVVGGGGPYPGKAWNKFDSAWEIYKPVDPEQYLLLKEPKIPITIRLTFQDKIIERNYLIAPRHTKMLVQVLNLVNGAASRIAISVKNIAHRTNRILAKVSNIRHKRKGP